MKNSVKSYVINIFIVTSLTIVALWFALKDNYQEVITMISGMKSYWLVLILFWGIMYSCISGYVLTIFTRKNKKDYRFREGLSNYLVGFFFSSITPSSTGGQFAQAYIFKKQKIKLSDGASILWGDFIIFQTTLMIYVTILFFLRYSYYVEIMGGILLVFILAGYGVNLAIIVVLWTMALFPKLYVKLSGNVVRILAKFKIVKDKEKTLVTWSEQVMSFTKEIKRLHHEKMLILKTAVLSVLRMSVQFSLSWVIANALGHPLGIEYLLDCLALSSFVMMANAFIPIPGSSGGTEFVFTMLYGYLLQDSALASSIMILWRFSTYHFIMIAGAITFVILKHKYTKESIKERGI